MRRKLSPSTEAVWRDRLARFRECNLTVKDDRSAAFSSAWAEVELPNGVRIRVPASHEGERALEPKVQPGGRDEIPGTAHSVRRRIEI